MSRQHLDDAALEKCHGMVRSIAGRVRTQMRLRVDLEDLVQAGMVGLMEAANRYDPDAGVAFTTFAYTRVRGSIVDSLHALTGIRRSQARQLSRLRAANEFMESHELAVESQNDARFVSQAITGAMFAADLSELREDVAPESEGDGDISPLRVDAERSIGRAQLRVLVLQSLEHLAEDEAEILRAHYLEGRTLQEVATEKGISRSWASRVHTRALRNAQSVLRRRYKVTEADLFDATKR
jgi:RNA polymerase sigma factor for flagellar operon FliA